MTALRQVPVTDEYARPVPGAQVYVSDRANAAASLFSDPAGTVPLAQPITADEFGIATYYAADGIYREDTWFLGKLRFREITLVGSVDVLKGLPGSPTAGSYATRAAIAALTPVGFDSVDLTEAGREGRFVFDASNLSAKVALEGTQLGGIYIAPNSDPTGVHGAWVRKFVGPGCITWWGPSTADDTARITAAYSVCPRITFPGQTYIVTSIVVPASAQLITEGFSTRFKQKAFTPPNTRLIKMQSGSAIVGDISVEGQLNQAGDTTGEQNAAIYIYIDAADTSGVGHVRVGNVDGKNIRGDLVMIGVHPTAYGAGYRLSDVQIGKITGDNIYRNGLSILGGSTIRFVGIECTHVGYADLVIEPDPGSGPVVDVKTGYTKGGYVLIAGATAAEYAEDIDLGHVELEGGGSAPQTSTPAYPVTRSHAMQIRNCKSWSYASFKANNYNGQAIKQVYNVGELPTQAWNLGATELTNVCLTEITYNAFILGAGAVTKLTIRGLTAAATLVSHNIVRSCTPAEIRDPVITGPVGAWLFINDCQKARLFNLNQTNGVVMQGSAGARVFGGSFNGAFAISFCDDATFYDVDVVASTAYNSGSTGAKFYGGSLGGVRNSLTIYNAATVMVAVDGNGITTGFEFHAANFLKGYLFDLAGNQVVGQRNAHIAHVGGAAGPNPTAAEFNTHTAAINAILAFLELWGALEP